MKSLTPASSDINTYVQTDVKTAMSAENIANSSVGAELHTTGFIVTTSDQHWDYTRTAARNVKCDLCNLQISEIIANQGRSDPSALNTSNDDDGDYADDHGTICRVMQCCDTCAFTSCRVCFDAGRLDSRHPLTQVEDLNWSLRGGKGKGVRATLASTRPQRSRTTRKVLFSPDAKADSNGTVSKPRTSACSGNGVTRSLSYREQLYSDESESDESTFEGSNMNVLLRAANQESNGFRNIAPASSADSQSRPASIYNPARPTNPFSVRRDGNNKSKLLRSPSTPSRPQRPPAASATTHLHRLDIRRQQPVTPPQRTRASIGTDRHPTSVFSNSDTSYADFSGLATAPSLPVRPQHFSSEHGSSSPYPVPSSQHRQPAISTGNRPFGTTTTPFQPSTALLNSSVANARDRVHQLTTYIRSNAQFSSDLRVERELSNAIAAVGQLDLVWRTNPDVSWERRYRGLSAALDLVEASFTLNVIGPQHGDNPFTSALGVAWIDGMRMALDVAGFGNAG